eukprot:TRINITY_DN980_c0_g1::TRINITY_DN980_c0_g1_i1::g.16116::m.16116 TRINITY_DN980_c0_g1::TRINITY_DN980_c0_g1_i1::g.16116  ORF type:complete len:170 (+),score=-6.80,sp/Q147X3/NAA30_HUMAN/64.47/3e-59,Acetyltransf_1/PF00583.19/6.6e-17,Acetyltransf_7/PF13508.1/4.4e-09,Acetyltransf_10/PF13673.1/6.1e-09,FR47/PF08445.5/4.5e-08,Acetyltransf_3/PF13302.1/8.4e-07,Acetyltransf_8/PF13523.1/4.2e-06,Acetyltransf_9/PF13527.1/0.0012,Acetyltransf_6/PF13480.1/0.03,Acetyltransf_6/PF13480.1/6.4e+03,Acetyltransf_13/PF13880
MTESETLSNSILPKLKYVPWHNELQLPGLIELIDKDLSEPYSIFTYRYFIRLWPQLCFLCLDAETSKIVGVIVCKLDQHRHRYRGYIAMLAVHESYRRRNIGTTLVRLAIEAMYTEGADEVVLETEVTNLGALILYEKLGFIRDKRLHRYYLNGVDAFRLKMFLRDLPM